MTKEIMDYGITKIQTIFKTSESLNQPTLHLKIRDFCVQYRKILDCLNASDKSSQIASQFIFRYMEPMESIIVNYSKIVQKLSPEESAKNIENFKQLMHLQDGFMKQFLTGLHETDLWKLDAEMHVLKTSFKMDGLI